MSAYIRKLSSLQIIILGFAAVILLGALVLLLPWATRDGQGASFGDALFTAVSAVCVTGLVVRDTATYWSSFGQAVILILIQIGGLGVITVALGIALFSGKKIGLKQRSIMQEAMSAPGVGGILQLTGFILKLTAAAELAGALLLYPSFSRDFGPLRGLWYAAFHAISAFCNAGFDLMGIREPYSSLTAYTQDPLVNLVIMGLIVSGGLGFLTWKDIRKNRHHLRKYKMQTKVVLAVTAILVLAPAVLLFLFEGKELPLHERILSALFQSVTTRTAGFNTAELTSYSENGQMLMILLMLVGGSPGSTAGGMKTTTLAVLTATAFAVFRKDSDTGLFGRRLAPETVRSAMAILMMYLVLFLGGGMLIAGLEGLPLLTCLFETASAVGTVGLTLGITAGLGTGAKCILMMLMFLGRIGGITLFLALFSGERGKTSRLPQESISIG